MMRPGIITTTLVALSITCWARQNHSVGRNENAATMTSRGRSNFDLLSFLLIASAISTPLYPKTLTVARSRRE